MEYQLAFSLARKFYALLEPACAQAMIVGSVRRADDKARTKGVHDIEILLIPKADVATDMFGHPLPDDQQPANALDELLAQLKEQNIIAVPQIARKADGQRYKKFAIPGYNYFDPIERKTKEFCLELWIVTPKTWGIQAVIRTGPSEFSASFVNPDTEIFFHKASGKRLRGLLPAYYQYVAGETRIVVRSTGEELDLPTEESVIALLGLNSSDNHWIDPSERYLYVKEVK